MCKSSATEHFGNTVCATLTLFFLCRFKGKDAVAGTTPVAATPVSTPAEVAAKMKQRSARFETVRAHLEFGQGVISVRLQHTWREVGGQGVDAGWLYMGPR